MGPAARVRDRPGAGDQRIESRVRTEFDRRRRGARHEERLRRGRRVGRGGGRILRPPLGDAGIRRPRFGPRVLRRRRPARGWRLARSLAGTHPPRLRRPGLAVGAGRRRARPRRRAQRADRQRSSARGPARAAARGGLHLPGPHRQPRARRRGAPRLPAARRRDAGRRRLPAALRALHRQRRPRRIFLVRCLHRAASGFTPPPNAQCFGATPGEAGVEGDPVVLVDDHGGAITALDAPIDAVFNATDTRTLASGASAQLTWLRGAAGRHDAFIAGASVDAADTRYRSGTEVAALQADRGVTGLGIDIGNPEFNVGLRSRSRVAGLYASATLSPAPALHLTAALRWNAARLRLRDQLGTALDGTHHYSRLNATAGFVWTAAPALDAYASYATNSRVPSPAELSCADPARACRFPNAFLADPPLRDVRVRTVEAGVRGRAAIAGTTLEYSAAAFVTRARDDIVFIAAGPITGSGYFDTVDASRRRGLEASVDARGQRFAAYAAYAFIDATFGATLAILAPDNPGADADGLVHVRPGNRMPSIPRHTFKAGIRYAATARLTLGTGMVATSNRYLRGDEANLGRPIGGHLTLDASAVVNAGGIEWYARVENLGNARYASFGLYGDPTAAGLQSPRFLSPGAPRTFLVGLRIRR
ncbi:MAG: TonB-dependent receptor [Steroidobacteraceae bacterium]